MTRGPTRRAAAGLLLLGALGGMCAGCRGARLPPEATAPIRIGVVLTHDLDGAAYNEAIEVATREVNSVGGPLPGRRVELLIAESMNDPDIAQSEAQRLIDAGAIAILGDGGSTNTLAIAMHVTTPNEIPHLSCSATSTRLTQLNEGFANPDDRYFFRTAPDDALQAVALASVALIEGMCTDVVILHQNDDYGTPIADALETELMMGGRNVTAVIPYDYGAASYASEVDAAIAAAPNCVAVIGYPQEAGIIVREWETAGGRVVQWLGADALLSDMFVSTAGSAARINGFLGTAPETAPTSGEYGTFRDRYRATFALPASEEPVAYTANCYDAAALLYLAIAAAGSTEGPAIRDALRELIGSAGARVVRPAELGNGFEFLRAGTPVDYEGASGHVDFDEFGNVRANYVVWQFQDGTTPTFATIRMINADSL